MAPLVTNTLPLASWETILGITCWGGLKRAVAIGGLLDSGKTAKVRAFNGNGSTVDLTDNPGTGVSGSGLYADGGRGQGVGVYSNCDLFVCGLQDSNPSNKCFRFQVSDQTWIALPDMIGDVNFAHQVFCFGLPDGTMHTTLEKGYSYLLDAGGTTWTDITNPDPDLGGNYFGACRLSNGKLFYVCDVFSGFGNPITLHCFTWDAGTWTTLASFGPFSVTGKELSDLRVVPLDTGTALVVIGLVDNVGGHETRAYLFDGVSLSATGDPSIPRSLFGLSGSYTGEAFLIGGRTGVATIPTPVTTSIERYSEGGWAAFDDLPVGVYSPASVVLPGSAGSRLIVAGGVDTDGNTVDSVPEYAAAADAGDPMACDCPVEALPPNTGGKSTPGEDIYLDVSSSQGPDRFVTPSGDWLLVSGREALRQSLLRRFMTAPGEWATKPQYGAGARQFAKSRSTRSRRDDLAVRLRTQALQDERVAKVSTVVVQLSAETVKFTVRVIPRGALGRQGAIDISGEV